ncbi:hypothetical protein SAMN05421578_107114 [Paenibacillus macquariensis]|uniref:Uncharacterized protein n=1 Tax=Paenibacillus macquariensis TaxID=948756 RepID=A0ABY1K1E3_9BACL|nr:hypothetical protein SAMN05421578_107114 [Paenibacillus macquariensis]
MSLIDIKTKDFFTTISNNGQVNFEYIYEQGLLKDNSGKVSNFPHKSKMKYYSREAVKEFEMWNEKGYGIYFLPNGGGYKDAEITDFRSVFADLDIKDEIEYEFINEGFEGNGAELKNLVTEKFNSLNNSEKVQYKQIFMRRIDDLRTNALIPSGIVETKNGFHVYYFLKQETQKHQFEAIEGLLIYCLNGDLAVKNPARLLRVPLTQHLKDRNDPFTIQLNEWNPKISYDAESVLSILRGIVAQNNKESLLCVNDRKKPLYNTKELSKAGGIPSRRGIDYSLMMIGNIPLISQGFKGLPELKKRLGLDKQPELCYIDRDDIRQYLKKQNLKHLLGMESDRFFCLFHNSSNSSSGTIYPHGDKYFYKCHSSNCGVHYDIIQIMERLTRFPIHKSFDYLKELYNIAEVKTEWQQDQERLIDFNTEFLSRFKYDIELRELYPFLTKFLDTKGTLGLLIQIHEVARRKLPQLAKVKGMNNPIVFAPMGKVIEDVLSINESSLRNIDMANTKAVILIFMFLLNCVGVSELPDELQKRAREYQQKGIERNGKTIHYTNMSRYYEVVSLDTDRLILAEEMAKFFYKKGLTISGFNREQVLRLRGSEEANRIYPDRVEEEISSLNQSITSEIERVVAELIHRKSYTYDNEIIDNIVIPDFDIKQEFRNTFKYIKNKKSEAIDLLEIHDNDVNMLRWYRNFISKKLVLNMPVITHHEELSRTRVNKSIRNKFGIPGNVKGFIYHPEVVEKSIQIEAEGMASKIIRLTQQDSSLSYNKIAKMVGCSRQYVSNVIKNNG